MRGAFNAGGRGGGFEVAKSGIDGSTTHVDQRLTVPKYRTVISIQQGGSPPRPAATTPSSNGHLLDDGPRQVTAVDGVDPDETGSLASSTSSSWTGRGGLLNGHNRSPSGSSTASTVSSSVPSYIIRPAGSFASPSSPRRVSAAAASTDTDDQQQQRQHVEDHPFFALFRDSPHEDWHIVSGRGTVRGVRNRVRSGIAVFVDKHDPSRQKDYRSSERGKVVLYTTGVKVVRDTYDKCLRVKKILQTHMVRYEERDISIQRDNHRDLAERLDSSAVELPQVFADGVHIGGANDIEKLNENGTLRKIFQHFQSVPTAAECAECGGYRYTPCRNCHGSKKSRRNHFTVEFSALRCTACDDNGLVLCQTCAAAIDNSTDF